jgi:hypothetical protein
VGRGPETAGDEAGLRGEKTLAREIGKVHLRIGCGGAGTRPLVESRFRIHKPLADKLLAHKPLAHKLLAVRARALADTSATLG